MQSLFDWLITLPAGALYTVMAAVAAFENVVPPFPSDVVVALGAFVASQGDKTMLGSVLAAWLGNVAGAVFMYALGRRYGAERLERRLAGKNAESVDARIRALFERFGMPAVFVSRFVPGVRGVVPVFAGALRLSLWRTTAMIACASLIWYGLIVVVAFRVGSDWPQLRASIAHYNRALGLGATLILILGVTAWFLTRRRQRDREAKTPRSS